jgi:hypothetical protein
MSSLDRDSISLSLVLCHVGMHELNDVWPDRSNEHSWQSCGSLLLSIAIDGLHGYEGASGSHGAA